MKIAINKRTGRMAALLAGLMLLAAGACTNDPTEAGGRYDQGARSEMTLEFGLSAEQAGERTRATAEGDVESAAFASSRVETLWVGVFDVETGNLVGKTTADSQEHPDLATGSVKVDILYYDAHPTVRIFGVANYTDVRGGYLKPKAENPDETEEVKGDLKSLLAGITTLKEFRTLAIETESADEALRASNAPLMMGVLATGALNYTVDSEGNRGNTAWDSRTDVRLIPVDASNSSNGKYARLDYKVLNGYKIYLRRLLSEINVTVEADANIQLSNISYRRIYFPREVYLQERTTYSANVQNDMKTFRTWITKTPNRADVLLDPTRKTAERTSDISQAYASDEAFTPADGNRFTFHHYENKHWGLNTVSSYAERDNYLKDKIETQKSLPIFSSLCWPSVATDTDPNPMPNDYNNYASCFEIKMQVVDNAQHVGGEVIYLIHEGYCNAADGTPQANNAQDFMCVRNTRYNYTVTVSGLNLFTVRVATEGTSHDDAHPGGDLWVIREENELTTAVGAVANPAATTIGTAQPFTLPAVDRTGMLYRFYMRRPGTGGDEVVDYGNWNPETARPIAGADYWPLLTGALQLDTYAGTDLLAEGRYRFTREGQTYTLDQLMAAFGEGTEEIAFETTYNGVLPGTNYNPAEYPRLLLCYFPSEDVEDYDTCTTRHTLHVYRYVDVDQRAPMTEQGWVNLDGFVLTNSFAGNAGNEPAVAGHVGRTVTLSWHSEVCAQAAAGGQQGNYAFNIYCNDRQLASKLPASTLDYDPGSQTFSYTFEADDATLAVLNGLAAGAHTDALGFAFQTVDLTGAQADSDKYSTPSGSLYIYPTSFDWTTTSSGNWTNRGETDGIYAGAFAYGSYPRDVYTELQFTGSAALDVSTRARVQAASGNRLTFEALYDGILTLSVANTFNTTTDSGKRQIAPNETTNTDGRNVAVTNNGTKQHAFVAGSSNAAEAVTFYIRKGAVAIEALADIVDVYKVSFTYFGPGVSEPAKNWNFTNWSTNLFQYCFGKNYAEANQSSDPDMRGLLNFAIGIDGLQVQAGEGQRLRGDYGTANYIQVLGAGNPESHAQVFWFETCRPGTVKVLVSHTGSSLPSPIRTVTVTANGTAIGAPQEIDAVSGSPKEMTFTVSETHLHPDGPTRIYIYASGGARFYQIAYE